MKNNSRSNKKGKWSVRFIPQKQIKTNNKNFFKQRRWG